MRWGGGRGEVSSFGVDFLQSSPLVALRTFSRGCCCCYPGFIYGETESRCSKVTDSLLMQILKKDLALLGSSQVPTTR